MKSLWSKVPVIMQMESVECGAACLNMILAYYDKWIPLEKVRYSCGVSRDGSNAKNLLLAAKQYGLVASGFKSSARALQQSGEFPCILHWNFNHFVVLCGFHKDNAVINDPEEGRIEVAWEVFEQCFTGICLRMKPGEGFVTEGEPKSILAYIGKRMNGMKKAFLYSLIIGLLIACLALVQPVFLRVFVDRILGGSDKTWLRSFLLLVTLVTLVQLILLFLQRVGSLRIQGKFAIGTNASFLWHVLRLPMEFFSQRRTGDLLMRHRANEEVSRVIFTQLAPIVIHFVTLVFYLVVMLHYSCVLTGIGVLVISLDLWMARVISKKRVSITRVQMRNQAALYSTTVAGLEQMETIKSCGMEEVFFAKWAGMQASSGLHKVRYIRLNLFWGIIPDFLNQIGVSIILITGAWLVMQGELSAGILLAFQSFFVAFMNPAKEMISSSQVLQEMRTDMERIEDVMDYPEEIYEEDPTQEETEHKLTGEVCMEHVTFGYSRLAPPLLKDFSFHIKPGQRIAIVGSSGCGKSTVSRLITGLYQPWEGTITLDGKDRSKIQHEVFTGSVAVVDQEIALFADTISENIKMWDESIEDYEMILAAHDASIHEEIMKRPGGYQYALKEGGKDFSGGQRQRLELARVLAQDPSLLILDEATSALDAKTEYEIMEAIRKRGATCIVVAHRLSAIRDCDEILVMDAGKIVERGTHESLYALGGFYTRLVMDE